MLLERQTIELRTHIRIAYVPYGLVNVGLCLMRHARWNRLQLYVVFRRINITILVIDNNHGNGDTMNENNTETFNERLAITEIIHQPSFCHNIDVNK